MKWQVISPQSLHIRTWDGETVIYDARSGNTHLLGAEAALVLVTLMQTPADPASLIDKLSTPAADRNSGDMAKTVETILTELSCISLISPATP